jgi:hypothetical protein
MFEIMDMATILSYVMSNYIIYNYDYYPNCYTKDFIVDKLNESYMGGGSLFNKKKVIDMVFITFTKEKVVFIILNQLSY